MSTEQYSHNLPVPHQGGSAHPNAPALHQAYAMGQARDPGQGNNSPEPEESTLDLRDLWRLVMKHKGLLMGITTFGLLAALVVSFVRTPLYLASTTLQVDKRAAQVVQFNKDEALGGNQEGNDERTAMGTYLELLKSRVLAERVMDELQLDRMALPDDDTDTLGTEQAASADGDAGQQRDTGWAAMFENTWRKIQDSYGKVRRPTATNADKLNREKVLEAFKKTVVIEQVRNSRMLKVSVENASPQLATRIANTLGLQFIALNLERRMDSSSYAKNFLEGQLGTTKAKLEESERKLQEYARAKNILTLDEKTSVVNQTFTEFTGALAKAEQELYKAESEYEAIRTAPDTARQVLENKTIQSYKEQRAKLEAEYLENAKVYKDDFPKMQQLREKVAEYDAKIKQEMDATIISVRNHLTMTKRQDALIRTRLASARNEIVSGQERGVEFNLLKREVDTNRELYNGLLQQLKQVGVAGGVETNNIQVVDKAEVPLFPHKPKLALNAAIGLVAGLVLGLLLVFLMESLDDSIKFADEVEKVLQVPLLGVIPRVKPVAGLASMALLAHEDPRGHMAEAYRSVRTALQFSTAHGAPKRLVLTSTTKNEGKSTTALALAINFAQLGGKVVLVDGDMRNPTVHKFLSLTNGQGLSNYLSGSHAEGQVARPTDIDNLWVVTGGPIPPSPVDLLTGPKLGELMDLLEAQGAQYIIIDGPPVLGLADAIVLGNQVPSLLYVAQASQTRKSHIKDAFRRLRGAGIVPRGVVLTKTTAQNTAYYTYDNYYGYGVDAGKGAAAPAASTVPRVEPA